MSATTDNRPEVDAASRAALPAPVVEHIERCRSLPHPESHLVSTLHLLQGQAGFLGRDQLEAVAQLLRVPSSKVTGVATFYAFFRLEPRGRFLVNVCLGTACYVSGASDVMDKLKDELGIEVGQTSKDGLFTLEAARCLGTCGLAPVLLVEERAHAKVRPERIPAMLARYRQSVAEGAGSAVP